MSSDRDELWIALADLWLDTELSDGHLRSIADVVRRSGLTLAELDDVFELELAPFLGPNQRSPAGEWAGFDPDWVCAEARKRRGSRSLVERVKARSGLTTYAARPAFEAVMRLAFGSEQADDPRAER